MKVTLLGTGAPDGAPVLFTDDDSKPRLRPAMLIQNGTTNILFDAGPDIRQQLQRTGIDHLDAVFLTHFHFDHFWGVGDLAQLRWIQKNDFPVFVNSETQRVIDEHYPWLDLDVRVFGETESVGGITITPFAIRHSVQLHGFAIDGRVVYAPDILEILEPKKAMSPELLIADGMYYVKRYEDDEDHAFGEQLRTEIKRLQPKNVWLIAHSEWFTKVKVEDIELPESWSYPDDFTTMELS